MVDIEPSGDGASELVCKITDFGFACMMDPSKKITLSLGSPLYMAPEVIDRKSYNSKVDIWSLGVMAYMILTGKSPFNGKTKVDIFNKVRYGRVPLAELEKYHNEGELVKDFIKKCLTRDVKQRWSAEELLQHPWFKTLI